MTARARKMVAVGLVAVAIWQAGEAMAIHAKAWLAQRLIASAWKKSLEEGVGVKPWPWADTWPVARLDAPRQGESLMVLAGSSGRTLAFGPGHVDGTPLPGDSGNAVVSGHRDTHFAFLRDLRSGDDLVVETPNGRTIHYAVSGIEVVRNKDVRVLLDANDDRLTLVTCYPFDSPVPGGPLRYVVVATKQTHAPLSPARGHVSDGITRLRVARQASLPAPTTNSLRRVSDALSRQGRGSLEAGRALHDNSKT